MYVLQSGHLTSRPNAASSCVSNLRRHQMETFSALLALCAGNSPVTGEFPSQRQVTRSFDVFFDLHLNKLLSKQSRRLWFGTSSRSLWSHSDVTRFISCVAHETFPLGRQFKILCCNKNGPALFMYELYQPVQMDIINNVKWCNIKCMPLHAYLKSYLSSRD